MTENKKSMSKINLRSLRLSLKYRPEILKLIIKMRQCIRRRNSLLKSLKHRLKKLETKVMDTDSNAGTKLSGKDTLENASDIGQSISSTKTKKFQNSSTQTDSDVKAQDTKSEVPKEDAGWNLREVGKTEKSIAEQVKEVAQSALQDNGMVYVESAGMYYDYKTGYYYNSELGLYYHNDTGCYYYYSDDKQFVFHSYPDMSKVNTSLIAHQKKKERKLKRERHPEDGIDNLTKHLAQDKEEDGSKAKKPRKTNKTKKEKKEKGKDRKLKKVKEAKVKNIDGTEEKKEAVEEAKENIIKRIEETKEVIEEVKEEEEKEDKSDACTGKGPTEDRSTKIENIDIFSSATKNQESSKQNENNDNAVDIFENNDNSEVKIEKDDISEASNIDNKHDSKIDNENEVEMKVENENKDEDNEEEKKQAEELEEGECSDTESEDSGSESDASTSSVSDEDSIAKQHPPSMRVIVRETELSKLKVGSLFLITKDGGTVGREGDNHAILLKDHNVSRNHLDIRYDVARKTYVVADLGSKNGTILNGVRMAESQETSLPMDVLHGSTIQLGETKLLCHIHPGHTTCGQCEPGLLMQVEEEKKAAYTRTVSVKKQHELELARLKNIYAPQRLAIEEKPYNDRAQARREAVGSTNHAEKTQSTDLDTSIAPDNKGFKLLQKMGWSKGEGLGKDSQGETEPVPLISNDGKAGLGTTGAVAPPSNTPKPRVVKNNLAAATMRLAARTKMLQPPAKAFQNEDGDDFE